MGSALSMLKKIWKTPDLRYKIFYTLALLFIIRVIAAIPLPNIDIDRIQEAIESNQSLQLFSIISGGNLERFSIAAAGISPFITASIIMQLLTMIIPSIEEMKKEGAQGQKKINQYTRYLTVPIAIIQSIGLIAFFSSSAAQGGQPIIEGLDLVDYTQMVLTMVAGSIIFMWIGELITESGIGNGSSLIIFLGIAGILPSTITNVLSSASQYNRLAIWGLLILSIISVFLVVFVSEAKRVIPVTYSKRIRGNKPYGGGNSYIPLRVNSSGVIPIIFAISILSFPSLIANFFTQAKAQWIQDSANNVINFYNEQGFWYYLMYFVLVISFTYFYSVIVFNPEEVADNLKKQGGFVPGIRPGEATRQYLSMILNRLTFVGALFLGTVAILPFIIESFTGTTQSIVQGTSLLIMVSVVLETIRQIRSQFIMRDYEYLLDDKS